MIIFDFMLIFAFILFLALFSVGFFTKYKRTLKWLCCSIIDSIKKEFDETPPIIFVFITIFVVLIFLSPNQPLERKIIFIGIYFTLHTFIFLFNRLINPYKSITMSNISFLSVCMIPIILFFIAIRPTWNITTWYILLGTSFLLYLLNTTNVFNMLSLAKIKKLTIQNIWKNIIIILCFYVFIFTFTFFSISHINIDSFSKHLSLFDSIYFSIITFCTIGYGDILPVSALAKLIVILESLTSILCLTVFLNSIVSLQLNHSDNTDVTGVEIPNRRYVTAVSVLRTTYKIAITNKEEPEMKKILRLYWNPFRSPKSKCRVLSKINSSKFKDKRQYDLLSMAAKKYTFVA